MNKETMNYNWDSDSYLDTETKKYKVSVIVPVYGNINYTKNCLRDLYRLPADHEIIVFDNANDFEVADFIYQLEEEKTSGSPGLVYIGSPRNLGFSRSNNKAFKECRGEYVLWINNDIRVEKEHATWTQRLLTVAETGALVAANGGVVDHTFNFVRETTNKVDEPGFYLSGWCLMGKKEVFEQLILNTYCDDETDEVKEGRAWGPWDERFYKAYFEDTSLSFLAKEKGIPLEVVSVPVHHFGKITTKKLNMPALYLESQAIFRKIWSKNG